ncbi:hypothetical protein BASA81_009827 [Batrachochytrium salamandrivorans]|nr:hypothetical protein BASA81_009827 [Batrachochytrium salamandrivorans]
MARWFRATTAGTRTCYYEVLGVSRRDSLDTIKAAYFSLAKKHHPDTNPLHAQAASQTRFQEISEAYEFLSNPEKKQRYDAGISDGNFDPNGDPTLENLISIVRRHIVKQHQSTLFPTPAVEVVLTVTLDDLLHLGKDQHHITYQPFLQCDQCQGSGQVLIMKKLGHWTKRGGLGDLHVKVEIAPHLTFVRSSQNKFDLTALIAITLMESILGCSKPLWGTGMFM